MFVAARFSSNLAIYRLYFLQMKTVLVESLYQIPADNSKEDKLQRGINRGLPRALEN